MASAIYTLFEKSFYTLSPWSWQQLFERQDIRIPDINEIGDAGSLLDIVLEKELAQNNLGQWSIDKDDGRFQPSPETERLALWLIGQGCNPWRLYHERDCWARAVELGWPKLMACLTEHPRAPKKEVLEHVLVPQSRHASTMVPAPASFALKNQVEALRAWKDLGFGVNLGVGSPHSAGRHAQTPEFFTAWAQLGGNAQAKNQDGKTWPQQWHFSSSAKHVSMEKAWAKFQNGLALPPPEAIEVISAELSKLTKARFLHLVKTHELNWSSQDANGITLRERVLRFHEAKPQAIAGSIVEAALDKATPEQWRNALVIGLRSMTAGSRNPHFPNMDQLSSALDRGRLGTDDRVTLQTLADGLLDGDHPEGFARLVSASMMTGRTFCDELNELPSVQATEQGFNRVKVRSAEFWKPWFAERTEDGVCKGWKMFAVWAKTSASSNGGSSLDLFWKVQLSLLEQEILREGKNLLRAAEILRSNPSNAPVFEETWEPTSVTKDGWTLPLVGLDNLDAPSPQSIKPVENELWQMMFKKAGRLEEWVGKKLRQEELNRLDEVLPETGLRSSRPRM